MDKNNLVVLKTTQPLFWESEGFKLNHVYRCLTPKETESDSYLINAFWFTQAEFDLYFEFAYDRIIRDWESFGLIENGKPISFAKFKKLLDVHTYNKQTLNLRLAFVGVSKVNMYKFIPIGYDNKAIQLRQMYERHYLETLKGNMIYFDAFKIKFGTFGVSVVYSQN